MYIFIESINSLESCRPRPITCLYYGRSLLSLNALTDFILEMSLVQWSYRGYKLLFVKNLEEKTTTFKDY